MLIWIIAHLTTRGDEEVKKMAYGEDTNGDVYKEGSEEELIENDEISAAEAGFISGYNDSEDEGEKSEEVEEWVGVSNFFFWYSDFYLIWIRI